jgi:hypothetical protein
VKRSVRSARKEVIAALDWGRITVEVAAKALRLSVSNVYKHRRECGVTSELHTTNNDERNAQMEEMYRSGETLESIASVFDVTRERVRQVVKSRGVPSKAAQIIRSIASAEKKEFQRKGIWDKRCASIYGCTYEIASDLNDGKKFSQPGGRARFYVEQRRNAIRRGIPWEITFPQWVEVWRESGRWDERGRSGYVMARVGDSGPYKVGNVEIITQSQNSKDGYLIVTAAERTEKRKWYKPQLSDPTRISGRCAEVRDLYLAGLPTVEIARRLNIKYRNAWQYVDQVKRKLALKETRTTAMP